MLKDLNGQKIERANHSRNDSLSQNTKENNPGLADPNNNPDIFRKKGYSNPLSPRFEKSENEFTTNPLVVQILNEYKKKKSPLREFNDANYLKPESQRGKTNGLTSTKEFAYSLPYSLNHHQSETKAAITNELLSPPSLYNTERVMATNDSGILFRIFKNTLNMQNWKFDFLKNA